MSKEKDMTKDKETDEGTEVVMSETWRPAHEVARSMLWDDPWDCVITLASMYGARHTIVPPIVPPKGIPGLISAFKQAKKRVIEHIDQAIAKLEEQAEEAKEKEEKRKKKEE